MSTPLQFGCQKKMTKKLEKYFYFSIYTNLLSLLPTNWTRPYPFQLVGPFYNKTINSFKIDNLIVYF